MSRNPTPKLAIAFNLALSGILLCTLFVVGNYGLNRPVSFDGAMNLQVAQSLSEGEGYVRHYEGTRAFPMEVQTNVPFIVPAAAVFKLFGVGLVQSQLVNFCYLLLFLLLVGYILARFFNPGIALAGAFACFLVPGFSHIGMNGWGELIALFWWLAGTYVLLRDDAGRADTRLVVLGGVCLGLALVTKTIMLIGLAVTLGVFGVSHLVANGRDIRSSLRSAAWVVVGVMGPIVAVEIWRWLELGSVAAYLAWWADQSSAIKWQTGATAATGFSNAGAEKTLAHFAVLAGLLKLSPAIVAAWLFLPIAASAWALFRAPLRTHMRRVWLALVLVAGVYLVWWLVATPDTHTRLRRIFNALVIAQLIWFFVFGWMREVIRGERQAGGGEKIFLSATMLAAVISQSVLVSHFPSEMRKYQRADMTPFYRVVDAVRSLRPEAKLFGKGFLSAPVLALYSGRHLDDIDRYTADDLSAIGVGYLLLDSAAVQARRFSPELRRYEHETMVFDAGYQVYAADFRRKRDPFSKAAHAAADTASRVDFTQTRYPFVYGMQGPGRQGWRWATTDAEVLLRHQDQPAVELFVHKPDKPYVKQRPLTLRVSVEGCGLGTQSISAPGRQAIFFNIPDECHLPQNRNVRLQIVADNMLQPVARNLKQMSYVVLAVGFADRSADTAQ